MKVSKNSWHYRFNEFVQGHSFHWRCKTQVITTCDYVRTTTYSFLAEFVKLLLVAIAVFALVVLLGCMFVAPALKLFGFWVLTDALVVAFISWAYLLGMLGCFAIAALASYIKKRYRVAQDNKQNLLRQTLQDKRDGVCTIIDFD